MSSFKHLINIIIISLAILIFQGFFSAVISQTPGVVQNLRSISGHKLNEPVPYSQITMEWSSPADYTLNNYFIRFNTNPSHYFDLEDLDGIFIEKNTVTSSIYDNNDDISYYFHIVAINYDQDDDEILGQVVSYGPMRIDNVKPSNISLIAPESTNSRSINLSLIVTGAYDMCISNIQYGACTWEKYASQIQWSLSEGGGTKNIYAQFRDLANNTANASTTTYLNTNSKPNISKINDQIIEISSSNTIIFSVNDNESSAYSLSVKAQSSNLSLVDSVAVIGSGITRTLLITPLSEKFGKSTITVVVSDPGGLTNSTDFTLIVDEEPYISEINDQTINEDSSLEAVSFTISDGQVQASNLTVSKESSNYSYVALENITIEGTESSRTISITPIANVFGTLTITVMVSDGSLTSTEAFILTITAINDTPEISQIQDQYAVEDQQVIINFTINDEETPSNSLDLTLNSSNINIVPVQNIQISGDNEDKTMTITPANNESGSTLITITLSDSQLTAARSFTLTITAQNDAPIISHIVDQYIFEDTANITLNITITDVESGSDNLNISTNSSDIAIVSLENIEVKGTGSNRILSITPTSDEYGQLTISISSSDGELTGTTSFALNITPVNDPPSISNISNQTTYEDIAINAVSFTINDIDNIDLNLSFISSNTDIICNDCINFYSQENDRFFSITPEKNQSGAVDITISVSDGQYTKCSNFSLQITPVNDTPYFSEISDITIIKNTISSINFTINDAEAGNLTLSFDSSNKNLIPNENLSITGTNNSKTLKITPATDQIGSSSISLTIVDFEGAYTNTSFIVNVISVNEPPYISKISDVTTFEGTATESIPFTVFDIDSSSYTITKNSSSLTVVSIENIVITGDLSNKFLQITPNTDQIGVSTITLTVTDDKGLTSSTSFELNVLKKNNPPEISDILDQNINEDSGALSLTFTVSDDETAVEDLNITINSSNTDLISNESMLISGTGEAKTLQILPNDNASGQITITISVSDLNLTTNNSFVINITEINDSPTISNINNQAIFEDSTIKDLGFEISDIETSVENLSISVASSNTNLISIENIEIKGSSAQKTLLITPTTNESGSSIITITVSDTIDSDSTSFVISVTPVNDAPSISFIQDQTIMEDSNSNIITFTVEDVDNEYNELNLQLLSSNIALIPIENTSFNGSSQEKFVSITPVADEFGTSQISIIVSDSSGLTSTSSFLLTVEEKNIAPEISDISDQSTFEDIAISAAFTVTDSQTPADNLRIKAVSSNINLIAQENISISGSGAQKIINLTPTTNESGSLTITLSVCDGVYTQTTSFAVNITPVNDSPVISDIDNCTTEEETPISINFTVSDVESTTDNLSITINSSNFDLIPENSSAISVDFDSNSILKLTPVVNATGSSIISITVSDPDGLTAKEQFTLTVTNINDRPILEQKFDTLTTINEDAIDNDGYLISDIIAGISDPDPNSLSGIAISYIKQDYGKWQYSDNNELWINIGTVNLDNAILLKSNQFIRFKPDEIHGEFASFSYYGWDQSDLLSPGTYINVFQQQQLQDESSISSSSSNIAITIKSVNDLPEISAIKNQKMLKNTSIDIQFSFSDLDHEQSELSLTIQSSNETLFPYSNIVTSGIGENRILSITPTTNNSGFANITISVSDGEDTSTKTFEIKVSDENREPWISNINNQSTQEDKAISISFSITDGEINEDRLSLSAESKNITLISNSNISITGQDIERTITITPNQDLNGSAEIMVTVNDGQYSSTTSFVLTVIPVNDPPSFMSIINDQSINEDTSLSNIVFTVNDIDSLTLTCKGFSSNQEILNDENIDIQGISSQRILSLTPTTNMNGPLTITVSLSDSALTVVQSFILNITPVNDKPEIYSIDDQKIYEDEPLFITITVKDIDHDDLIVTGISSDQSIVSDESIKCFGIISQRTIAITPTLNMSGTVKITLTVDDGSETDNTNSASFELSITPVNDGPELLDVKDYQILENSIPSGITFIANDIDSSSITIVINSSDQNILENMVLNYTSAVYPKEIQISPDTSKAGVIDISITVIDDKNLTSDSFFRLTIIEQDDPPIISDITDKQIDEDKIIKDILFTFSDEDSSNISITVNSSNQNIVKDSNISIEISENSGNISIKPTENMNGKITITVSASDDTSTVYEHFKLSIEPRNDYPVVSDILDQTINEDEFLSGITFTVFDADFDPLTITKISTNTDLVDIDSIFIMGDGIEKNLIIYPKENKFGETTIIFKITDAKNMDVFVNFILTVLNVNDAPELSDVFDQEILENVTYSNLGFYVKDVDPDYLTVTINSSNQDILKDETINYTSNTLKQKILIQPDTENAGFLNITISVSDSYTSISDSFALTIIEQNDAPSISDIKDSQTSEDSSISGITFTVFDPDSQNITVTCSHENLTITIAKDNDQYSLTVIPAQNLNGSFTLTVNAFDGLELSSKSFNLFVDKVPDQPEIFPINDQFIKEDTIADSINFTVIDADNEPLTITFSSSNQEIVKDKSISADGIGNTKTLTIKPLQNANGQISITITVNDGLYTVSQAFNLHITPVNDDPVITDVSDKITNEDIPLIIRFVAQDVDADPLSFSVTYSNKELIAEDNIVKLTDNITYSLTVYPTKNQSGQSMVTVTVNDKLVSKNISFNIKVEPLNDAPEISIIEDQYLNEDTSFNTAFNVFDAEADIFTITYKSSNQEIIPDSNIVAIKTVDEIQLSITPNENQNGIVIITISASDSLTTSNMSFNLTINEINDSPVISQLENITINEDEFIQGITLTIYDPDFDNLEIIAKSNNQTIVADENISIIGSEKIKELQIKPQKDQYGTCEISIKVSDPKGLSATTVFTLDINSVLDPPSISSIPVIWTEKNTSISSINFTVTDAESQPLSISVLAFSNKQALVLDKDIEIIGLLPQRSLSITPVEDATGSVLITIIASDHDNLTTVSSFTLNIHNPPEISNINDQETGQEIELKGVPFTINDDLTNYNKLILTGKSSDQALIPDQNIKFSGTNANRYINILPSENHYGNAIIEITVTDEGNLTATSSFMITVNSRPIIDEIDDIQIPEDSQTQSFTITVSDIETDLSELILSAGSSDEILVPIDNIIFNYLDDHHTAIIKPAKDKTGIAEITIFVQDEKGLIASTSFNLTVTEVSDSPVISMIADQFSEVSFTAGPISFTITDAESEPSQLITSAKSSNQNLVPDDHINFSGLTNIRSINIEPIPSNSGTSTITITVTDSDNMTSISIFNITFHYRPEISEISDQTIDEDTSTEPIPFTVSDDMTLDKDLIINAISSNPEITGDIKIEGEAEHKTMTITPVQEVFGKAVIEVIVSDSFGLTSSESFNLTVNEIKDRPVISNIDDQTIFMNNSSETLNFIISDPDTDINFIKFTIKSSNETLIPNDSSHIIIEENEEQKSIQIIPVPDKTGESMITISASDNSGLTQVLSFKVTVADPMPGEILALHAVSNHIIGQTSQESIIIMEWDPPQNYNDNSYLVAFNKNYIHDFESYDEDDIVTKTKASSPVLTNQDNIAYYFHVAAIGYGQEDKIFIGPVSSYGPLRIDNVAPTNLNVQVEEYVSSRNTLLTIVASGATEMCVYNFGEICIWETFSNSKLLFLTEGEGKKIINVKVKDLVGNIASTIAQTNLVNNLPPKIYQIKDQITKEDKPIDVVFMVSDTESKPENLTLTAASSNTNIVDTENMSFKGTDKMKTITISPKENMFGRTTITIGVTDEGGLTAYTSFALMITSENDKPYISEILDTDMDEDSGTKEINFQISDAETAVSELSLSISSSNKDIFPDNEENIKITGSDEDRKVLLNPIENAFGLAEITILVYEPSGLSNTESFIVNVKNINDPPQISNIMDIEIDEDTSTGNIDFSISDIESNSLSLTIETESMNNVIIPQKNIIVSHKADSTSICITPAQNKSGNTNIIVTVIDPEGLTASTSFSITINEINDYPQISEISDITMDEDTTTEIYYTVTDAETAHNEIKIDVISSDESLIPDDDEHIWIKFDGLLGRSISITPANNASGTATITIIAKDEQNYSVSADFQITVNPVNDPPSISSLSDKEYYEDSINNVIFFTVSDIESGNNLPPLQIYSSNNTLIPQDYNNLKLSGENGSYSLSINPAKDQYGQATITIIAKDTEGLTSSSSFNVNFIEVNDRPTISSINDIETDEDSAISPIVFTITDIETNPDNLNVNVFSNNNNLINKNNMIIQGQGENRSLELVLNNDAYGTATITLQVTDSNDLSETTQFNIIVNQVNDSPQISEINDQFIDEDSKTDIINFTISDPETKAISLNVWANSSNTDLVNDNNIIINQNNENISMQITPEPDKYGDAAINIFTSDPDGAIYSRTFNLNIRSVNDLPVISTIEDQILNENTISDPIGFTISDIETNSNDLTISVISSNPEIIDSNGLILSGDSNNRFLTIKHLTDKAGIVMITITVLDSDQAQSMVDFTLSINSKPEISYNPDQTIDEDTSLQALQYTILDSESSANDLSVTIKSQNESLIPIDDEHISITNDGNSFIFTITPVQNENGSSLIKIIVTDPQGLTTSTSFILNVTPVNDKPEISQIEHQFVQIHSRIEPIKITINDLETNSNDLLVFAYSSDYNLVSSDNINIERNDSILTLNIDQDLNNSGTATITLYIIDESNGTSQMSFDLTIHNPPYISDIGNQAILEDTETLELNFTVGDAESNAEELTVTAKSLDTNLVPNDNLHIILTGTGKNRTIQIIPLENKAGKTTIVLTVFDTGTLSSSKSFNLTVIQVNDPPLISDIPDQRININTATNDLSFTITDTESSPYSLSLDVVSSDENIVSQDQNHIILQGQQENWLLKIVPNKDMTGEVEITLTVTDHEGLKASDSFILIINGHPEISQIDDLTIDEDSIEFPVSFTLTDAQSLSDDISLTIISSDESIIANNSESLRLERNGINQILYITPEKDMYGSVTLTITATDYGYLTDSAQFVVNVNPVNDPPVISYIKDQVTLINTSIGPIDFTVTDVDNSSDSLNVYADSSEIDIVPDDNNYLILTGNAFQRSIKLIPIKDSYGKSIITLTVRDPDGLTSQTSFIATFDDRPSITDIDDITIDEDTQSKIINFNISDKETSAENMILSKTSSNKKLIPDDDMHILISGTGYNRNLKIIPAENEYGDAIITIIVADSEMITDSTSFKVTVNPVNDRPEISYIDDQEIFEDTSTSPIPITATDIENPEDLTITVISSNTELIANDSSSIMLTGTNNKTLIISPLKDKSGSSQITIVVSDPEGLTDFTKFNINVASVNDAPILDSETIELISIFEDDIDNQGQRISDFIANKIKDPDLNAKKGIAIYEMEPSTSGKWQYSIDSGQLWNDISEISKENALLLSIESMIRLVPDAFHEGGASFSFYAWDQAYALTPTSYANVLLENRGGSTAFSKIGAEVSITVNGDNDPPQISQISDQVININQSGIIEFQTDDDQESVNNLEFSAVSSNQNLVLNKNIIIEGEDNKRTIKISPNPNAQGLVTITITAAESKGGLTTNMSFSFYINHKPEISSFSDIYTIEDSAIEPIPFTVFDYETSSYSLVVFPHSSNENLVKNDPDHLRIQGNDDNRTLYIALNENQYSSTTITLTVVDNLSISTTVSFDIVVSSQNDKPEISKIEDQNIDEDSATEPLSFTINDVETEVQYLSLTCTSSNESLIPVDNDHILILGTDSSRTISLTPLENKNGNAVISLIAADEYSSTTMSFNLNVESINDVPEISDIDDITIIENSWAGPFSFTINDIETDINNLIVQASSSNHNLVIESPDYLNIQGQGALRQISITPVTNNVGNAIITIEVIDEGDLSAKTEFMLTVVHDYKPPEISEINDQTMSEDEQKALSFTVNDDYTDLDKLTIIASSSEKALVSDENLEITGTGNNRYIIIKPFENMNGSTIISIVVTDEQAMTACTNFTLVVNPVNDAPVLSVKNPHMIQIDEHQINNTGNLISDIIQSQINDPDNNPQYGIAIININANYGHFQYSTNAGGSFIDIGSLDKSTALLLRSIDVIRFVPDEIHGETASFDYLAWDQTTVNPGLIYNIENQGGTTAFSIESDTAKITVNEINDTPEIADIEDQKINKNSSTNKISIEINDPDDEGSDLMLDKACSNDLLIPLENIVLEGSGNTRFITITPATNIAGTATITITVSDKSFDSASTSFKIFVNDSPTISQINDITMDEDNISNKIVFTVSDPEDSPDKLTIIRSSSDKLKIADDEAHLSIVDGDLQGEKELLILPETNASGIVTITLTVYDSQNLSAASSFNVTINEINDLPTIELTQEELTIDEDSSITNLSLTIKDIESNSENLIIHLASSNTSIVPNKNLSYNGDGMFRFINIQPLENAFGSLSITITVFDEQDEKNSKVLKLNINPINDSPEISQISDISIDEDTASETINVTICDIETPYTNLTIIPNSSNTNLIKNENIIISGLSEIRTIKIIPEENKNGNSKITILVSDGENQTEQSFFVFVNAVNDAPILSKMDFELDSISEDITDEENNAILISDIIIDQITDYDAADLHGIAVLAVTPVNGTWQYCISENKNCDETNNFTNFPIIVNNNAFLLSSSDKIRFKPDSTRGGISSFEYYAWDMTYGTVGLFASITPNGGTTAFSLESNTVKIEVIDINDPPFFKTQISDQNILEDTMLTINLNIDDVDSQNLTLNYSSSINQLYPQETPDIKITGTGNERILTIQPLIDQTGTSEIALTITDGEKTANQSFSLTIINVNDAPILTTINPILTSINEDILDYFNQGDKVSDFISSSIDDPDTFDLKGIAIYSITPVEGKWQYYIQTNGQWKDIVDININNALLLSGNDKIRFLPDGRFGSISYFEYLAWDLTDGQPGDLKAITDTGYSSAFSIDSDIAKIYIEDVNDPPFFDTEIEDQDIFINTSTQYLFFMISDYESSPLDLSITYKSSNTVLVPEDDSHIITGILSSTGENRYIAIIPQNNQTGSCKITLTAFDGNDSTNTSFVLTVHKPADGKILSVYPLNNDEDIEIDVTIQVNFSNLMNKDTINNQTFKLYNIDKELIEGICSSIDEDGKTISSFVPSQSLPYSEHFIAVIDSDILDSSGQSLSPGYTWTFSTKRFPIAPAEAVNFENESIIEDDYLAVNISQAQYTNTMYNDLDILWRIKRADRKFDSYDNEPFFEYAKTDLDETQNEIFNLFSGMKYTWEAVYVDKSDKIVSRSTLYSFKVGESVTDNSLYIKPGSQIVDYEMVSFVQWPDDPKASSVLYNEINGDYNIKLYRIGTYDTLKGAYQYYNEGLEIIPGKAYWFLARNGMQISVDGVYVSKSRNIDVSLEYNESTNNGWNMIASPNNASYKWGDILVIKYDDNNEGMITFGPIAISNISNQSDPDNYTIVDKRLWRWENGQYEWSDNLENSNSEIQYFSDNAILEPYKGYWIKVKAKNVSLRFPSKSQIKDNEFYDTTYQPLSENLRKSLSKDNFPPAPVGSLDSNNYKLNAVDESGGGNCFIETVKSQNSLFFFLLIFILIFIKSNYLFSRIKSKY